MSSNEPKGQHFLDSYVEKWPCISRSTLGIYFAKCNACNCDFSVKHGGGNDIFKHVKTPKHERNLECLRGVAKIETFVKPPTANEIDVINAECLMTNFIIEHNLPVTVSDHMSDLIKLMCPDSKIAKDYRCKRTKTTHIMHAMASDVIEKLHSSIKNEPYSISTDGSESKTKQLYPILIRYPDSDLQKVVTKVCIN